MSRKYHLKKKVKRDLILLLIFIVLATVGGIYGYKVYQRKMYERTFEYRIMSQGFTLEEEKKLESVLTKDQLEDFIGKKFDSTNEYHEFIVPFINCKYFLYKNLDDYLKEVITQTDDFFKYHGTENYDYDAIIAYVNTHANIEPYTVSFDTNMDQGFAIITNKYYHLKDDYVPDDLVSVSNNYYYGEPKKIRKEVYDAFLEMWNAAYNEEGIYLIMIDAYRTAAEQIEAYQYYENLKGSKYADTIAARPSYSEHQTGLALDIYSKKDTRSETFKDSPTYQWLINNCYKYGFILRYPEGKEKITGYRFESWHYRYLGKELARKVYESGLTYDEYYAYYFED